MAERDLAAESHQQRQAERRQRMQGDDDRHVGGVAAVEDRHADQHQRERQHPPEPAHRALRSSSPNTPPGRSSRIAIRSRKAIAFFQPELSMPDASCSTTPRNSPPANAPSGLPRPPIMQATKPLSP